MKSSPTTPPTRQAAFEPTSAPSPLLSPTLPTTRSKNTPCASRIIPSLYISGLSCAEDETWLRRNHITHILSVLPERICIPTTLNIRTKQVPIGDTPFADIKSVLPDALDFIDAALCQNAVDVSPAHRANVLVHCQEGRSRSVTVVAAYLMKTFNMLPEAALDLIQSKRSVANPNFGFLLQLYEYARCSLGRHELQIPDAAALSRRNAKKDGPLNVDTYVPNRCLVANDLPSHGPPMPSHLTRSTVRRSPPPPLPLTLRAPRSSRLN